MKSILTSIHGSQFGLSKDNELVLRNPNTGVTEVVASPASVGAGAKNGSTVSADEAGNGIVRKTTLTLTNHVITLADEAGVVAYGGSKIYDMPAGVICVLGATANLTVTKSSAGVNADWDGAFGLGTFTASNNATLASTEQNIIPTTATPQAVAGATTAKGGSTAIAYADGSATAVDIFLNFLVDDADHNVAGTACNLIISGTIDMYWINLGDF